MFTVFAADKDAGLNKRITYAITGGNEVSAYSSQIIWVEEKRRQGFAINCSLIYEKRINVKNCTTS